jgi:hypothetical protein
MKDPTLQQKIKFLSEKLSIGGWKPGQQCPGRTEHVSRLRTQPYECFCECGWRGSASATYVQHTHWHEVPAPDLLKPEGHLMLEEALFADGWNIIIDHALMRIQLWRETDHRHNRTPIKDGNFPLALILAAYDALHKE